MRPLITRSFSWQIIFRRKFRSNFWVTRWVVNLSFFASRAEPASEVHHINLLSTKNFDWQFRFNEFRSHSLFINIFFSCCCCYSSSSSFISCAASHSFQCRRTKNYYRFYFAIWEIWNVRPMWWPLLLPGSIWLIGHHKYHTYTHTFTFTPRP